MWVGRLTATRAGSDDDHHHTRMGKCIYIHCYKKLEARARWPERQGDTRSKIGGRNGALLVGL